MSDRHPAALIAAYNVVQNLVIRDHHYVPANLAMTAGLVAIAKTRGCSWDDLGLDVRKAAAGLRLGRVGALLTASVTAAAATNPAFRHYFLDERANGHDDDEVRYRALVRFPLGTALFEEVAFRGVITALERRAGASKTEAALATAVAFGLWHIIPAASALRGNPLEREMDSAFSTIIAVAVGVLSTAVASLGLSWMRDRSGSLVAPWLTHAALNTTTYLCGVAAWRRLEGGNHG